MNYFIKKYKISDDLKKEIYNSSLNLAHERGLKIHRGKELSDYVIDNDDEIIGALFVSDNISDFNFDIVVDKLWENKKIGLSLITLAIKEYRDLKKIYGSDYKLVVEVVNPKMKNILEKHFNLKTTQVLKKGENWIMTESKNTSKKNELMNIASFIEKEGIIYFKKSKVTAEPTKGGERIQTITSDGIETDIIAKEEDILITNIDTLVKEKYVISKKMFEKRYIPTSEFGIFESIGDSIVVKINKRFLTKFNLKEKFYFLTSWGEEMVAKEGDYLSINPETKEVYRIANKEFQETYKIADPEFIVGIEVEREHYESYEIRKKITLDHLKENSNYYSILFKSGLVDEERAVELANKYFN